MFGDSKKSNTDLSNLPENAVIRLPDVLRLFPVSKSRWWSGVSTGEYPKPVHLGARARGWRIEDIRELIERLSSEALNEQ